MPAAYPAVITRLLRPRRWVFALTAVSAVAVCLLGPAAAPALAHAHLVASTPRDGATVEVAPARIVLRFDEPVHASSAQVAVTAPNGSPVATGDVAVLDAVVSADVSALPAAGDYTVGWRIVSADGHPLEGDIAFTATAAAADKARSDSTSGAESPANDSAGGAESDSTWLARQAWYLTAAAAVIAIGLVLWTLERRTRRDDARTG